MSFEALNAALSGLRVAQQQLTTISNNVSNATTPGYTRKLLPQGTQVINSTGQTIGVQSGTLIRNVDLNLERELWTQVSSVSATETKAAYLDQIEKFHGVTNKEQSIAAEIADLKDKFAALSDSPSDGSLLQTALAQAQTVATKFNEYGNLVTQLRNDAQDEMSQSVDRINDLLGTISSLNGDIKGSANLNRSSAALEDKRDEAIKELAGYMDLTMFKRGDGVLVLQTSRGVQLCDETPSQVYFNSNNIGATATYPTGAAGIYIGGNPAVVKTAVDITASSIGGKLGALVELRDNTLMQYQSQMDELAHKLALRLESQGLKLFTDPTGTVPADTPPDPTTNPPTSVKYVGFASTIQVNKDILNNIQLLQQGTYTSDLAIPSGSNEVIRRVIQYGFGNISHQAISGTTNLNATAPATDLQSWLGLRSTNNVVGGIDFSSFAQIDDGVASSSDLKDTMQQFFPSWPANDQLQITFAEPRLGLGPTTVTLDLSAAAANFPIGGAVHDALDQITSEINAQITAAGVPAGLAATATRNTNGQLVIQSRGNVSIDGSSFAGSMGKTALTALGLQEKSYTTEDPYFDVQVGNGNVTRIKIEPGDDVTDLVNKLQYNPLTGAGVPGLMVDYNSVTGRLSLRPGMDDSNGGPKFGGDIKIISGPGQTTAAVNAAISALPSSVGVVSALFGSFSVSGGVVKETSPVQNIAYGSETKAGSGVFVAFRKDNVGPGAAVGTNVLSGQNVVDFSQKVVNAQAQDIILNDQTMSDSTTLRDLLSERLLSESGVNIDEELSNLIVIQTAYSAAARAVSAASDMFDELLNSIR